MAMQKVGPTCNPVTIFNERNTWILIGCEVDSILDEVLTVSPKIQYRGIFKPNKKSTKWRHKWKKCVQTELNDI